MPKVRDYRKPKPPKISKETQMYVGFGGTPLEAQFSPEEFLEIQREQDNEVHLPISPTAIRDRLNKIIELVDVCTVALTHQDYKNQEYIQKRVAGVLCDFVTPELVTAEKELRNV